MKGQWQLRRQFQTTADAQRRWDQAYQHLLRWTLERNRQTAAVIPPPVSSTPEETNDENSDLCTSIDRAADARSHH